MSIMINLENDSVDSFIAILRRIDSGEHVVEVAPIEQGSEDYNNDPQEGNVIPNLNGQFYIKESEDEPLSGLADLILIGFEGQPNWVNIKRVKDEGFDVFPTEKDSFGWLGGAVRTKKGLIFFG